ncbi:MAG: ribosome silencing factor [Myxococcales bacterium]|nr:ribosome silencing factor [Myxococcales bacterium]
MRKPSARIRSHTTTTSSTRRQRKAPSTRQAVSKDVQRLALAIGAVALDKKASRVEIIDVRDKVDYADYVIVMSGRSDRQVKALARHIETELASTQGTKPLSTEGMTQASWVLIDYGDVVVHIFHDDTRDYYDLESLWMDAKRVPLE